MPYKLKPGVESFEVVDGPFAGKKFLRGKVYEKIPPEEKKKFEQVKAQGPAHSSPEEHASHSTGQAKLKPARQDPAGGAESKKTKPKTEELKKTS